MGIASYFELRRRAGRRSRPNGCKAPPRKWPNVFGRSARQRIVRMQKLMKRPAVLRYLAAREAAHETAIRAAVRTYLGTAIEIGDVELWDPDGRACSRPARRSPRRPATALAEQLEAAEGAGNGRDRPAASSKARGCVYPIGGRVEFGRPDSSATSSNDGDLESVADPTDGGAPHAD